MRKLLIILFLVWVFCGCSWQGQKYPVGEVASKPVYDQWWSMRFLWMSNGIEAYTKTANYETGFDVQQSRTDANSIEALSKGIADLIIERL